MVSGGGGCMCVHASVRVSVSVCMCVTLEYVHALHPAPHLLLLLRTSTTAIHLAMTIDGLDR